MTKILISLCIALSVAACATRKPAPISDANKAQVEEKSITADGAGTQGAGGAGGGQGNQAGGANGAGVRGDGSDAMNDGGRGGADGATGAGAAGANGGGVVPGKNAAGALSQRSIYFEYDSFAVKDEYKPIVQAHAKFLVENPTAKVYLQGHTDERGSREYNLALGQKIGRASCRERVCYPV